MKFLEIEIICKFTDNSRLSLPSSDVHYLCKVFSSVKNVTKEKQLKVDKKKIAAQAKIFKLHCPFLGKLLVMHRLIGTGNNQKYLVIGTGSHRRSQGGGAKGAIAPLNWRKMVIRPP